MTAIRTVRDLMAAVREGNSTSLGGYPLYFYMEDGETMCPTCIRDNIFQVARATRDRNDRQWAVEGHDINYEDQEMQCANCNEQIKPAYLEDEDEDEDPEDEEVTDGPYLNKTVKFSGCAADVVADDGVTWVTVVMVGDDTRHRMPREDCEFLEEEDYCAECGQIGCTHDGRERE